MRMRNHSFLQMCKCLALLPFLLSSGCVMDKGVGILVYDLADNHAVSFVPQNYPERQSCLLIQRGAKGDTFFTFDKGSDGKSFISERGINGDIVSKWETTIPEPYYPMQTMALSPNLEKVAFLIRPERATTYKSSHLAPVPGVRITMLDGTLLKTLDERPKGLIGLNKRIHWLSDETIITSSHLWENRSDQIIRYDLKADKETTKDYFFARSITSALVLPSPDNQHVLLLRKSDNHVDILDPWTMTLVGEVQIAPEPKGIKSIDAAWLDSNEFLAWDSYSSQIIQYNISTRQSKLVKPEFPSKKYKICTFVGNHFILRRDGDCSMWSYNVKTGKLSKISRYAVGCVYPLNDNIILLDRAIHPQNPWNIIN